ncbi:ABC transporter permease [Paludibacterium denitrificans]|uniref:ABC transporter permease n=1 Tax=Paludibacterium denitrificans TaxID=2675226 RepID=UPI0024780E08|nr:hypothetical protein [Paludibacterium denitrificans]
MDVYNFIPRLMFNRADLPATGLIQEGTRARWRLMLAGEDRQVDAIRQWLAPHLPAGARLENVEDARPEVRTALERARRFLGLTAMLTVSLAAAAVTLAVRRYLARHWQSVAVLRCMGLTSREVGGLFVSVFVLLGLCLSRDRRRAGLRGAGGPDAVGHQLGGRGTAAAGDTDLVAGATGGPALLGGLALPPLLAIRQVTPLAVLRDERPARRPGWLAPLLAMLALLALAAWQVGDARLAGWLLAAMLLFFAAVGVLARAVVALLRRLPSGGTVGWRFGLANMARRPRLAVVQMVALAVGLMALLTLTVVRGDLIDARQRSIPADAPNKFVINIQPPQKAALQQAFVQSGRRAPELSPMVRARLLAINEVPVHPAAYGDERARRLAEREFNLSWRDTLPPGNQLAAYQWWSGHRPPPQFSVERGLAETLGIRLGDTLAFDIAGTTYRARVTSLREVPWDSFRVNFFVLAPPSLFANQLSQLDYQFPPAPGWRAIHQPAGGTVSQPHRD